MKATAIYAKLSQADTITTEYTDAHNILATKTNGSEFLQLLLQQVHPLLAIKHIATTDIPKYSLFKNLFRYAREIKSYVNNHTLKRQSLSNREITHIFLSHLDEDRYSSAIRKCEMAILHGTTIDDIYLVPAITGTINQMALHIATPSPTTETKTIQQHHHRKSRIQQLSDYC